MKAIYAAGIYAQRHCEPRTTGRHQRLTTTLHGEHHITISLHSPLRVGTLAAHVTMSRDDLVVRLFE